MSTLQRQRVFITRKIPYVLDLLRSSNLNVDYYDQVDKSISRQDLIDRVKGCSGIYCLITDKVDREILDAAGPNLKVVSTMSVGYNHIDIEECQKRGIQVGYTPGVLDTATAELAVGLTLSTARRLIESASAAKKGEWGDWSPFQYCGFDVSNKTVGIIGLGRIGMTYAKMMKGFNCNILYSGPREKPDFAAHVNAVYCNFDEILDRSDIISVHCPLSSETTNLFDANAFSKMKKTALFINTSRGPIVDQKALYNALFNKTIAAAGIDVTTPEPLPADHELYSLSNCVILPHIGSATVATREKMASIALENLLAGVNDKKLKHAV